MCSVCLEDVVEAKVFCQGCKETMCGPCYDKYPDKCPTCVQPRGNNTILAEFAEYSQLCRWFEARGLTLIVRTVTQQDSVAFNQEINRRALAAVQELDAKENNMDTIIEALDRGLKLVFLLAVRYDGEIEEFGAGSKLSLADYVLLAIKSPIPGQSYLVVWVK